MPALSRRRFLRTVGTLTGGLWLSGCQVLPTFRGSRCFTGWVGQLPPLDPCHDRIRPVHIDSIVPPEHSVVRPLRYRLLSGELAYVLHVEFRRWRERGIDYPTEARLFLDGCQQELSRSCYKGTCSWIEAEIYSLLRPAKHVAAVDFKDEEGRRYAYRWVFYTDPGDDSVRTLFTACDRAVPKSMHLYSPAENRAFLVGERVRVAVAFNAEVVQCPDSVRLFVDGKDRTGGVAWDESVIVPSPWKAMRYEIPSERLVPGKHTVRVEFAEKTGETTTYDWNFYVLKDAESLAF